MPVSRSLFTFWSRSLGRAEEAEKGHKTRVKYELENKKETAKQFLKCVFGAHWSSCGFQRSLFLCANLIIFLAMVRWAVLRGVARSQKVSRGPGLLKHQFLLFFSFGQPNYLLSPQKGQRRRSLTKDSPQIPNRKKRVSLVATNFLMRKWGKAALRPSQVGSFYGFLMLQHYY